MGKFRERIAKNQEFCQGIAKKCEFLPIIAKNKNLSEDREKKMRISSKYFEKRKKHKFHGIITIEKT